MLEYSLIALAIVWGVSPIAPARAQTADTAYHIELHVEGGPMTTMFLRTRTIPRGASAITGGYNAIGRIMWHPDHLFAIGLLSGTQLLVTENYYVADSAADGHVWATLHGLPIMIDESMQTHGFEVGLALGAYILFSQLRDETTTISTRMELGTIGHAAYHWSLSDRVGLGLEFFASYMAYRGIFSIAPQADLVYDIPY